MPNLIRSGGRFNPLFPTVIPSPTVEADFNNSYSYLKGRMFERWIDRGIIFTAATSDICTASENHYHLNGQTVRMTTSDTLPAGLSLATTYYIINRTDTTFKVSTSKGGSAVDITDTGTGVHTVARYNGYSEDGLIECPPYIIESLLRDEIFAERDLKITTVTDTTHIIIDELQSPTDDYYNSVIYYNATTLHKTYITDYVGATKTLVLAVADASAASTNNVFITNIQGSTKIDYASFDTIGNTTDGSRGTTATKWIFAKSIYRKENARDLLASLCFESHCILNFSNQVYKLIALDDGTEDATWTAVAYDSGREGISSALTPLENVYTSFRLKYHYDYGKGDYVKEWFVDGNGYTTGGTYLGATQQTLCADAKTNYKIVNPFEYGCNWIYDDETAEMLLVKLVAWFTKQRWITSWTQTFKDYCQYDIGDKIILNYADFIPNALNNSSKFMIFGKTIVESKGRTYINFNMMEL